MKEKSLAILFSALFFCTLTSIEAKVWRVNNRPGFNANFSSLSTAISNSSVLAGDTLYVEGSPNSYGSITLSKRLVILGAGYFLNDNDSTQAFAYPSKLDNFTVSSGAQGSFISGVYITLSSYSNTVSINTDNITFSRCYIENTYSSSSGYAIYFNSNVKNTTIENCFIYRTYNSSYAIYLYGNNDNINISNNIIKCGTKTSSGTAIYMPTSCINTYITNNVIIGNLYAYSSYVVNNIQINGSLYNDQINFYSIFYNNIGQSTQFGTNDGNQSNINMATVFTYGPGNENIDNHYQLLAGSPAIAAGYTGEDCGAFGGNKPYKLSGLPAIPAIFDAVMPAPATWYPTNTSINVNIKAKGHE